MFEDYHQVWNALARVHKQLEMRHDQVAVDKLENTMVDFSLQMAQSLSKQPLEEKICKDCVLKKQMNSIIKVDKDSPSKSPFLE